MKVRLLAVMAVVVVGVMAGTSPAMAKKAHTASAWSHQHKDNKIFGEAIHNLRLANDSTNWTVTKITEASVAALTSLQNGLVSLAASYGNFQYGFVQLVFPNLPGSAGGPKPLTYFMETPRLDPTSAQSTVSKTFRISAQLGGSAGTLGAEVGVRSLSSPTAQDNDSTAYCGVTLSNPNGTISTNNNAAAANLNFFPIQRSTLSPENKSDKLFSLVGEVTGDKVVDMATSSKANATLTNVAGALTVSLTCTAINNKDLIDNGITPPFAS